MSRITEKHLKSVIDTLNRMTGNPLESYVKDDKGLYQAQIGNFHLDSAYGGHKLVQMMSDKGGIRDVLSQGYMTKRELYEKMIAYKYGLLDAAETK